MAFGKRKLQRSSASLKQVCYITSSDAATLDCEAQPTLESNSIVSMLAHVCSGAWSAILPLSVLDLIGTPAGMQVLPLIEPAVDWAKGLVVPQRQPRLPMLEALLTEAVSLNDSFAKDE